MVRSTQPRKFLNGGIDRRVLAADAHPGEKAEQQETPEAEGERRGGSRGDVEREGDEEQFAPTETVGQPAKKQRPQHRAADIGAAGQADVGVGQVQDRAVFQRPGH
jgi:hypothetical protein